MEKDWQKLRDQYPTFTFDKFSYQLQGLDFVIAFSFYSGNTYHFSPTVRIKNVNPTRLQSLPKAIIDNLVFHLGLIELFSYWKLTISPTIEITCSTLTDEQIDFWQQLLVLGMGEYIYKNRIDVAAVKSTVIKTSGPTLPLFEQPLANRAIVPVGGGKDSVVALEITKSIKETMAFTLNKTPAMQEIITLSGIDKTIEVKRRLDPLLLDLNKQGFLNGHTPFSAYLALLTTLCAVLFDYQDIVLANERSANQGNVDYQRITINHQYSKTFQFEKDFHDYAKKHLAGEVNYFSVLRPFYEIQIAKLFRQYKQFFQSFRSCNIGQKTNSWCGKCPKCLFVYTMLYPFISYDQLIKIFGQDLFTKLSLLPILKELLGLEKAKPFECVGTYEEVRGALYRSLEHKKENQVLVSFFAAEILPNYPNIESDVNQLLASWNDENLVPKEYRERLKA